MKYSFAAILFAIGVTSVAAGGNLILCKDINLQDCVTIPYLDNTCPNLSSDLEDEVSSVDLDGSGHSCCIYVDRNCEGDKYCFTKHHNTLPNNIDDHVSSFKCTD